MTVRVTLISPAASAGLREARFGSDTALTDSGRRAAEGAAGLLPGAEQVFAGPSRRCAQTAAALGLASVAGPGPADLDTGGWRGRTLDDLAAADPAALAGWLADPAAAPHGGESVLGLVARVGAWLEARSGRVLAVVEPAVVRAAVVHALALPPQAFWRLDVEPLTLTRLTGGGGRWNLSCGERLTRRPAD
ncbi:histidine phosphatase family protein [Kitasatospora sp. NPDC048540]|uniref:histidine phosphatase family protein n=1 Tax=unclassified Kitasatospora TaxID=2633591 RepID=UPI00053ADB70|nr:histidine phosphatase family protein [Kitasatospora sp. MBT63]